MTVHAIGSNLFCSYLVLLARTIIYLNLIQVRLHVDYHPPFSIEPPGHL